MYAYTGICMYVCIYLCMHIYVLYANYSSLKYYH